LTLNRTSELVPVGNAPPAGPLNDEERTELLRLETLITDKWDTFLIVGEALVKIRDGRLYRDKFKNFGQYCRAVFDYQRAHLTRLTLAAQTYAIISPLERGKEPTTENKLRPLYRLTPEDVKVAWGKIIQEAGEGKIEAKIIEKVAGEFRSKSGRTRKTKKPAAGSATLRRALELIAQIEDGFRLGCEPQEGLEWVAELKHCVKALASGKK
jgi:hypothetical protein